MSCDFILKHTFFLDPHYTNTVYKLQRMCPDVSYKSSNNSANGRNVIEIIYSVKPETE